MQKYTLQPSRRIAGGWVCTDTEALVTVTFEAHRFNDTQRFEVLRDSKFQPVTADTAQQLAEIARQMGDWLRENHPDKIF